jgi:hypothetical protein
MLSKWIVIQLSAWVDSFYSKHVNIRLDSKSLPEETFYLIAQKLNWQKMKFYRIDLERKLRKERITLNSFRILLKFSSQKSLKPNQIFLKKYLLVQGPLLKNFFL